MATVLITGASAGIGAELARVCAREGHDVVLSARRRERLEELASELREQRGVAAHVCPADLSRPGAPRELFEASQQHRVTILMNNAGFGQGGSFDAIPLDTDLEMMQLNMVSLVALTKLFLPGMLERGQGRVLNVASTAAFQPGPGMAVYCASKAFVLSFSEAIRHELRGRGISVTALCPGPTRTRFQERAGMANSALFKKGAPGIVDVTQVAEQGYRGMMAGKAVVIPGVLNKAGAYGGRLAPHSLSAAIASKLMKT